MAVVNHEAHLVVSALLADVAHQFDDKIVFLASDMQSFMTGYALEMDGTECVKLT